MSYSLHKLTTYIIGALYSNDDYLLNHIVLLLTLDYHNEVI